MTPQFKALQDALEGRRAELSDSAVSSDPELVAVFDLVGPVDGFLRAVRDMPGLEFIADLAEAGLEPDDDFFFEQDGEPSDDLVPQSLYMIMSNAQAVVELVRLFELWQADPQVTFDRGLAPLKAVFENLRALRRWGPEDRVRETGLLDRWREDVQVIGQQGTSRVEIELWYRSDTGQRAIAESHVADLIGTAGGTVIRASSIDAIAYHAVLADLPYNQVERVLAEGPEAIELLTTDSVMFVSPSLPMTFQMPDAEDGPVAVDSPVPTGPPRVALLDGLPMANHTLLDGRLVIDDPDDVSVLYGTAQQLHGTAMASLLAHGDLSSPGSPMTTPIYVRPVLQPHPFFPRQEITRPDELLVDLIHRSFHRMFEGDGNGPPAAPSVRIVNLSIGDPARVFVRHLSPLAKLLDWLAHRYNLVIIVSAGNHPAAPTVSAERLTGDTEQIREDVARRAHTDAHHRRLLSPAEAVNVLTIGASHDDDAVTELPDSVIDLVEAGLPATYSPLGFGFRRSVKPEVLFPGGRQVHLRPPPGATGLVPLEAATTVAHGPGLRTSAPGTAGDRTATSYSSGTSNAAALASRTVDEIIDGLTRIKAEDGEFQFPDAQFHPVLAKAMLVHAASWGDRGSRLETLLGLEGRNVRRQLTQLLGYGPVDGQRVATADRVRAVLVGASSITADARHTYSFPLPTSLSATTMWRRLTITLAWLSPINTRSQRHRMARLSFSPPDDTLGVNRTQADHAAVVKGTVQHEVLEGQAAVAFTSGQAMAVHVDCRVDAGRLEAPVRYAIVASVEVGEDVLVDVHDEVRTALRAEVQQRIRQATTG